MNNKNGEWYKKTTGYIWKFIRYIWKCMNGRKWYSLLLLLSSLYVWKYRFEINQLKELNAKNIIFILWIFLLAFPLFSEMEILGIKVKKEVEKATEEVKESLKNIQTQIIQLQMNNSVSNKISIENTPLPSEHSRICRKIFLVQKKRFRSWRFRTTEIKIYFYSRLDKK